MACKVVNGYTRYQEVLRQALLLQNLLLVANGLVQRAANKVWMGEADFSFIKAWGARNAGHFNRRTTQMNVKYGSAFMAYLPDEALGFPATNNASTTKFNFLLISLPKILVISQKVCYLCTRLKVMEVVAQSVRASDCGSEGRGFEPHLPPRQSRFDLFRVGFFFFATPHTSLSPFSV